MAASTLLPDILQAVMRGQPRALATRTIRAGIWHP